MMILLILLLNWVCFVFYILCVYIELCKLAGSEDQNEWYFFSHKDKKYPTGTRTNRATKAGFWKATGRDKAIYARHSLVGMRKTLVFYKGRAPNGQKSDWIMHEYRLETNENATPQVQLLLTHPLLFYYTPYLLNTYQTLDDTIDIFRYYSLSDSLTLH